MIEWFKRFFKKKIVDSTDYSRFKPDNIHDDSPYREKLRQRVRDAIKMIYHDGGIDLPRSDILVDQLEALGYTVKEGREYSSTWRYVVAPICLKANEIEINRKMFE